MRRLVLLLAAGCHDPAAATPDAPDVIADAAPDAPAAVGALPALAFCTVTDPTNLAAAWSTTTDGSYVNYTCAQPCTGDWHACEFNFVDSQGVAVRGRGNLQFQGLVFVVDGIGGHLVFSPDGTDVVLTHAGAGGTTPLNKFDRALQALSPDIKTVTLGWAPGTPTIIVQTGGGWFTRKDSTPTTVRAQAARPAAVITWVHDELAAGHKFATVGSSMGTAATFGARVWYGLDALWDYQMLISGPGFWDVNAGCGRVHISAGFCDTDVSPCTGAARSSFGDNDPMCPGGDATNSCRVPTIMAPLANNQSSYNNIINYVHVTDTCMPLQTDARDPTLDASSMATTVTNWTFGSRIDFVLDEGGAQPPDADQGMGEGHMAYMYNAIQSAKGWYDNDGRHHSESFEGPQPLIQASAQIVVDHLYN